jgi:hypothetical protein
MPGAPDSSSTRPTLSAFQRLVLERLTPALPDFFLTGGSALGEFYLGHRTSLDLDLFTHDAEAFDRVDVVVGRVAADLGAAVAAGRSGPGFRRYVLERAGEQVVVDFVLDSAPVIDADKPVIRGTRVDTLREIAVNKLCALLGRSELKDLIDLHALATAGLDPLALLDLAARKDGGFTPATLAWSLSNLRLSPLPPGLLIPVVPEELARFRDALVADLVRLAHPNAGSKA